MGLHTINREITFPNLPDRVKDGIAYFLHYYNGEFSIIVSRNPNPDKIRIWYVREGEPTARVPFRDSDVGYWADDGRHNGHAVFDWGTVSIINNADDPTIIKRYQRPQ